MNTNNSNTSEIAILGSAVNVICMFDTHDFKKGNENFNNGLAIQYSILNTSKVKNK